ncbi:pyridoxamine 5'-phosphate oxidase family protein [Amycolatopsis pigmentata]|uniref:Pyridoxamine 5'-phosphate oxidase family protein n=1 Tax=Amycolatopsis pigmentata TaxID=450801 RepID=A0ABW5G185_9PSEU
MTKQVRELTAAESWRRLRGISLGRIVFSMRALPAIRPASHLVDEGDIIIRGHPDSPVGNAAGQVVAYEADEFDPGAHLGWSVVMTGLATAIDDPADTARYELLLRPWVRRAMNSLVRITPEIVTGYEVVAETEFGGPVPGDLSDVS